MSRATFGFRALTNGEPDRAIVTVRVHLSPKRVRTLEVGGPVNGVRLPLGYVFYRPDTTGRSGMVARFGGRWRVLEITEETP